MLREYLDSHGIRHSFFADKLGVSRMQMSRMLRPGFTPTLDIIDKVEKMTLGNVKYKDWWKSYVEVASGKENIA
jgi:transcriptional regulator with XRE-family HTH domain